MHHILFHQLSGNRCAKALDIHGVPGCKVDDIAQSLCRTFGVHTAQSRFIFQMNDRCAAGRTDGWHFVGLSILCMAGDTDHFRDDIASLAHLNGIADAKTKLMDKIFIVQCCAGNRGACQKYGVKAGGRRQHTGTAHCDLNAAQGSFLDLRRILKGDCPAREFVGGAHQIALCKAVHFYNSTIHIKVQLCTVLPDLLDLCNGLLNIMHHMITRRHRQSQTLEIVQTFRMLCEGFAADLLHIKNKNRKPPAAGYFGVLLTQGTGSSIARIFERRSALQLLLCAELLERSVRHIHLTAHFQKLWCILQFFGNTADGTDIGCYVFAYYAIAAGGGTNQLTILIFQAAGKTIDLDLDHILRLCACFAHTAVKVAQFIIRKSIQKALHFDRVGHLGQFAAGRAAHLLRGRRRRYQLRKLCFQCLQLPGQGIILKIFQFRCILIIIKPIVFFNDRAQLFHALLCLFQLQKIHSPALRLFLRCIPDLLVGQCCRTGFIFVSIPHFPVLCKGIRFV